MPEAQSLQGDQDSTHPGLGLLTEASAGKEELGETLLEVCSQAPTMALYYRSLCILSADIL